MSIEQALVFAGKRDLAKDMAGPCSLCRSQQVQLIDWLGAAAKFKCRQCGHKWSTAFTKGMTA